MPEIIPAIMPETYGELKRQVSRVRSLVETVQIDIMDDVFVPEKTWPYGDEDQEIFSRIIVGAEKMPRAGEIAYEADLMIANPEDEISRWISSGISRAVVHIESTNAIEQILDDLYAANIKRGLALSVTTPNEKLYPWFHKIDFVQFMGIAQIGYQGQPFDERVITKVKDLRTKYPNIIISVDGGVNLQTAPRLISAGVNRLVSGSAIWESENVKETIKRLQALAVRV